MGKSVYRSPQQTTVPSARMPQDFAQPMLTEENWPDGGEVRRSSSEPQHWTVPSGRIPQLCEMPLVIETYV